MTDIIDLLLRQNPYMYIYPYTITITLMKKGERQILGTFSSLAFGGRDLKPSRGDGSWSNLTPHGVCDQL